MEKEQKKMIDTVFPFIYQEISFPLPISSGPEESILVIYQHLFQKDKKITPNFSF